MCTAGNVATTIYTAPGAVVDDRRLWVTQQPAGVGNNYIYAVMDPAPPNMGSNDLVIVTLQGNNGVHGVVHYAGLTNGGVDVAGAVATASSLIVFMRVGNEIGELIVPTDGNGATDPGTYPTNFTSWGQPCAGGQNMNDFKVRKPWTAATTNYVARCNNNTTNTDSLFLGDGASGGTTIASAAAGDPTMRLSDYLRIGNSDVIFNGDDPTKGTFIRAGDPTTLVTPHKVDVEGVAGRSSVFFTSTPTQAGAKMFFATLDAAIVPAKLFRVDVTEATLPNLWTVPMMGTTNTATLSAQTDLVKWDPISPIGPMGQPPTGYVAAGADIVHTTAKFVWLNAAGDFIILNKIIATPPMSADIVAGRGIAVDQLSTLVLWSEYDGTNSVIKTKNVVCTGS